MAIRFDSEKRLLTVFAGPPGVGKTTHAEALSSAIETLGISSLFINEFDYFWKCITSMDRNDHTLLEWGKPKPDGRTPLHVTSKGYYIAFEETINGVFKEYKESGANLVTTEGARAVGDYPYSRYYGGLIQRIKKDDKLAQNTKLAHVEIRVRDVDDHIGRVDRRSKKYHNAAPVEVLLEYLAEKHHPTASQDATKFPQFIINQVLYNDKKAVDEEEAQLFAVEAMQGVITQVARYFNV